MYCKLCDWKFSATVKGLVPEHWSREPRWLSNKQAKCSTSGKNAEKNSTRRPTWGDSKGMECHGCHKRYRRIAHGRLAHHKVNGERCNGIPTERLSDMP